MMRLYIKAGRIGYVVISIALAILLATALRFPMPYGTDYNEMSREYFAIEIIHLDRFYRYDVEVELSKSCHLVACIYIPNYTRTYPLIDVEMMINYSAIVEAVANCTTLEELKDALESMNMTAVYAATGNYHKFSYESNDIGGIVVATVNPDRDAPQFRYASRVNVYAILLPSEIAYKTSIPILALGIVLAAGRAVHDVKRLLLKLKR